MTLETSTREAVHISQIRQHYLLYAEKSQQASPLFEDCIFPCSLLLRLDALQKKKKTLCSKG